MLVCCCNDGDDDDDNDEDIDGDDIDPLEGNVPLSKYIQPLIAAPLDHSNILSPTTTSFVSVTVGCEVKALFSSPVNITASLMSFPLRKTKHRDEDVTPVIWICMCDREGVEVVTSKTVY